ncbi:HNH endonuclease signature motif containing protein [Nocardioides solisilvae]|uniref:HNH endonuclease signature motif containing protein n=1 Tax=Nocardioides solisilvae TaxID=1542435 RepID=UPI000D746D02|nr:HNH endonuclease signature motif containing protein [Nocardioides solisilvae]
MARRPLLLPDFSGVGEVPPVRDVPGALVSTLGLMTGAGTTSLAGSWGDEPGEPRVPLDDLDAAGVLAAAKAELRVRRAAEVAELELAARWALLHGGDPAEDPTASRMDRLVCLGGEGTPWVRDLCIGELALVRGCGWSTQRSAVADVLDLQHRLPLTWARVRAGEAEAWVARRVAVASRHLGADVVGVVDAAVARIIAGESPARVLEVAAAKVIEADPEAHAHRVALERARRYVAVGRSDEAGLRHVIARVQAGDAVYVEAMVERVAEILRERLCAAGVPADERPTHDQLRSEAFGWLARPAGLLTLLLEHHPDNHPDQPDQPDKEPGETDEPGEPGDPGGRSVSRALAFPADLLAALRCVDPAQLRPTARVHVHVTAQGLVDAEASVARVEELGPLLVARLAELLGHAHVELQPVVNLAEEVRGTAYEHTDRLKERVWLRAGGERFPWSRHQGRRVDHDHPQPWSATGPPGQTGTHNSQPLCRRHHRWKTHAGVRVWQVDRVRWLWRTPHGHWFLVGPDGTVPVTDTLDS